MNHRCPIHDCDRTVPYHKLMCPTHYRLVPFAMQRDLYEHWHLGYPDSLHARARLDAISFVNDLIRAEALERHCRERQAQDDRT